MKKLYFILAFLLLWSCDSNKTQPERVDNKKTENSDSVVPKVSNEIIVDILQSIPSPLELSLLIQKIGTDYNRASLSDPTRVANYNNSFRQSLSLGVYSTDLGYANLYGKNQDVLDFLNSVKELADNLNIGQFFDYNTIKKLAQSSSNLDSLLRITQQNFEKINVHLQDQKREHLSILILTGGWIEGLYLSSLVYEKTKNPQLREKIGEQKVALEQILLVLDIYKTKPNFGVLIDDLKELQKIYNRVKITITAGDPVMVESKNGELIIEQGTVSTVEIDEKDLESIISLLKSIRNKII